MATLSPATALPAPARARAAVAVVFFVNGAAFANWVTRIPAVAERLHADVGQLGTVLLAPALGALLAMTPIGRLISRYGSRRPVRVLAVVYCATVASVGAAPTLSLLALALFAFGMANGGVDVAMNAHGLAVEQRYGRSVMNGFHAWFSIGALAGSATGSLAAQADIGPGTHLALTGLVGGVLAAVATQWLLPAGVDATAPTVPVRRGGARRLLPGRVTMPVAVLGLLGLAVLLIEGATADWSALYLHDVAGVGPGVAGLGYLAFSLTMTAGRLVGDRVTARVGRPSVVRGGGLLAAAGLGLAVAAPGPLTAVPGLAVLGLGLAGIVPAVFSAAGELGARVGRTGTVVSRVTTVSYLGFLFGPPLIGAVADRIGLRLALLAPVVLAAGVAGAAGVVRAPAPAPSPAESPL